MTKAMLVSFQKEGDSTEVMTYWPTGPWNRYWNTLQLILYATSCFRSIIFIKKHCFHLSQEQCNGLMSSVDSITVLLFFLYLTWLSGTIVRRAGLSSLVSILKVVKSSWMELFQKNIFLRIFFLLHMFIILYFTNISAETFCINILLHAEARSYDMDWVFGDHPGMWRR